MSDGWTLVEPCAGSAALTMHLLGARRAILPYQGSKWKFRRQLAARAAALGFEGPPSRVILTDPGPWGRALSVILDPDDRPTRLVGWLKAYGRQDPIHVFSSLVGQRVPTDPAQYAAQFLFLQRLAFSGKAVGTQDGGWYSPGFNTSSAYGIAATERFGEVKPMIPSLIRTLESYALATPEVVCRQERAELPDRVDGRTLVYLDPHYAGTTPYPDGDIGRDEVITLADGWRDLGATVMLSERSFPSRRRWEWEYLASGAKDDSPFKSKHPEMLMWSA